MDLHQQVVAGALVAEQEDDAAAGFGNLGHRRAQAPAPRLVDLQQVAQRVHVVHAHQGRLFRADLADGQREVNLIGHRVAVGDQVEVAELAVQRLFAEAGDGAFVDQAVVDQVGDGADLDAVLFGEGFQLRTTGHGAVVVHDFADHA
ncbi:hypothetical protein D9M71_568360 [compost metagenome]